MNYVNDWWAGFAELMLLCMMYELWMMFRYKIMSVWRGELWFEGLGAF